jgi:hypothetical protein
MKLVSMEFPNIIKMFSESRKNSIFTVNLYNVPQYYVENSVGKTVFINHSETIIIADGFYVSSDFGTLMSNYFLSAIKPNKGTVVADLVDISGVPTYVAREPSAYTDASTNQLVYNGLKYLVLEVSDISSRTIIRSREKTDTLPTADPSNPAQPNYRAFDGSYATNRQYSPEFYFELDFNVQEDKSFTDYYKEGGIFIRKLTYETQTINGQPVKVMIDPDPNGNECATTSKQRTHLTSSTLQCYRPRLDPNTGQVTRSNTKMRPLYKNAGWAMGFYKDVYTVKKSMANQMVLDRSASFLPTIYNRYIESESSYGSSVAQYFFLELDDYNRNFTTNTIIAETGGGTHLGNNIIARIPITAPSLNINHANPSDLIFKQRDYFGPVKIEKLHLHLIDKYGETLDIQNNDYSVAIELTTTY